MDSRFLTVAGAALALRQETTRTCFPFHPTAVTWPYGHRGHLRRMMLRRRKDFILETLAARGAIRPRLQFTFKMGRYYLTGKPFSNRLMFMKGDLTALEDKIEQFLAFCQSLRAENQALRSRVAGLEDERQLLTNKIDTTRTRLEALMAKLPEEE